MKKRISILIVLCIIAAACFTFSGCKDNSIVIESIAFEKSVCAIGIDEIIELKILVNPSKAKANISVFVDDIDIAYIAEYNIAPANNVAVNIANKTAVKITANNFGTAKITAYTLNVKAKQLETWCIVHVIGNTGKSFTQIKELFGKSSYIYVGQSFDDGLDFGKTAFYAFYRPADISSSSQEINVVIFKTEADALLALPSYQRYKSDAKIEGNNIYYGTFDAMELYESEKAKLYFYY